MRATVAALLRPLAGLGLTAAWLAGCQLVVGGDVPDFRCVGSDPRACPSGQRCDLATNRCAPSSAALDGGAPDDGEAPSPEDADAGDVDADVDAGPRPVGGSCLRDVDCASGVCGTRVLLGALVPQGDGLCTQPCCSSAQCPEGSVCTGPATGGNYCVPLAVAKRETVGTEPAGVACGAAGDCRSGACVEGRCLDTCCQDADCVAPAICRLVAANPALGMAETFACAPPLAGATRDAGATCAVAADCRTNLCGSPSPARCRVHCCGRASCGGGSTACLGGELPGQVFTTWCNPTTVGQTKENGATCSYSDECASDFCDPLSKKCVERCCVDGDCTGAGERCLPAPPPGAPYLRCVVP